jgi:hypothetical protein
MSSYRVTIRHGRPQRYHMVDVEAEDLAEALRQAAERMPAEARGGDLVEVRRSTAPEAREYVPG